ncbi:hypothetical protein CJ030_MR1G002653 [Morella rubra]|uniref:Uncharacterized protein n=1 Tax=Morella rubra TaxID=262757 RepID=A0A6A1WVY7_9ROSI|nr:hypothetical protein CJ030_MR1G002653 [Morella rubra]
MACGHQKMHEKIEKMKALQLQHKSEGKSYTEVEIFVEILVAVFLAHEVALLSPGLASSSAMKKSASEGHDYSNADFPPVEPIEEQDFPQQPLPDDPTTNFLEDCALRFSLNLRWKIFLW